MKIAIITDIHHGPQSHTKEPGWDALQVMRDCIWHAGEQGADLLDDADLRAGGSGGLGLGRLRRGLWCGCRVWSGGGSGRWGRRGLGGGCGWMRSRSGRGLRRGGRLRCGSGVLCWCGDDRFGRGLRCRCRRRP